MDDNGIIELYWNRSEQAIVETSLKYENMCINIAQNIIYNLQDAEECVNDTYLGLWNTIPPARPQFLAAFIAKITRNLAMKKITYLNAKKRSVQVTISFSELDECTMTPDNIANDIEAEELAECLEHFLGNLDYESRNIFLRRYWFFDSISDIAERFKISESKVKSKLYRIRGKLKQNLIREGYLNG